VARDDAKTDSAVSFRGNRLGECVRFFGLRG